MGHDRKKNAGSKNKDTDAKKSFGNTDSERIEKKTRTNCFSTYLNEFQTSLHLEKIYNFKTPRFENQKLRELETEKMLVCLRPAPVCESVVLPGGSDGGSCV